MLNITKVIDTTEKHVHLRKEMSQRATNQQLCLGTTTAWGKMAEWQKSNVLVLTMSVNVFHKHLGINGCHRFDAI